MAAVLSPAAPAAMTSTLAMPNSGLAPALLELPPNIYFDTPGVAQQILRARYREPEPSRSRSRTPPRRSTFVDAEKADLPFLIAQFGSASSTTWLEQRYKIWRGEQSTDEAPRIQGYLHHHDWLFAWGDPICLENAEEMKATASEMWAWAKKQKRHLVWCCISDSFAQVLADGVGPKGKKWSTLSCIREDVLHPSQVKLTGKDIKQNLRRAQKADLTIDELVLDAPTFLPDEKTKKQIEEGIEGWRANRHGRQIASASLLPWLDASSRRYFVARAHGEIVALCILTPIHHDSYQIKNSIHFPNSPRGTSEALLTHVIKTMKEEGRNALSFGASATEVLYLEHNIGGWSIKLLAKGYKEIVKRTGLAKRGQFRSKFDTEQGELLHVSFPPHGMGWAGLVGLMSVLRA
ncbi:hypothetical protein BCR35DRAFT_298295 [Leucosporidium creatinivorum]|uniref:Phosphatidylglycerol lysyltransferase C-terminal domain-containing protein n=1 Tax=Leucosporidium creatinivorum TaxID=106004 RepID=A0A1Y2G4D2_9BASI|nr:hypothetical protein BCR35DRAFT_298295 [Leucosporidium creatinivorum]